MGCVELTLIGSVAKVLNEGLGTEATLATVAETLRRELPVAAVTIWLREMGTTAFRAVQAPPSPDGPRPVGALASVAQRPGWHRVPLVHEGARLGLLEAPAGDSAAEAQVLTVVADLLALYLAAAELSADLAGEVAVQWREMDQHRRLTSLVIDSLPVGLYVVDRDYRIQSWNRKRETGTQGLRRDEVVGRPVFEVLTRQPADQLRAEFDRVFETGEIQQTEHEVTFAGETRYFRLSKIPMRLEGDAITHVITIGEDATEWHRVQGRILQSEKLAAVGQLAAGVMHEINNPLATISACVAAIEGRFPAGDEAGQAREYLGTIDREVDRCVRIVDGLLDFSRPKATPKRPVALNALVDDTLFLLKHHDHFRRLQVVRLLSPTLPDAVGSAEQLIQMLMALMLNAIDAMEQGGQLTVRTATSPVRGDEVVVEVEDTGEGIPRANRSKIFEPFYTTKPPGRGTGLGLSICYGIVADHRGRIEVDGAPGRGTIFRVFLPVHA
ncbi:MAG: ATP-binding protein [Gemmatimonadales bacterium]